MERINIKWIGILASALVFLCVSVLIAETPGTTSTKTADKTQSQLAAKTPVLKGKTVNINKATENDLVKNIPLITPDLAKKIVKYRKDNGDFQTLEELLQIDGFNRDLLRKMKPFLLLEGIGGKDCTC
jgi:competence ComEA-like helix-hairpin-helix protein